MKGDGQQLPSPTQGAWEPQHTGKILAVQLSANNSLSLSRLPPPGKPGFTPSVWTCEHLSYVLGATPGIRNRTGTKTGDALPPTAQMSAQG